MTRLGTILLAVTMLSIVGCGGSAGVDQGSIHGVVFGNASGGSASEAPLAGVTIVAVREGGEPEIIRTTQTDANGEFVFTDLPTGSYTLGYDIQGYRTITTEEGNTIDRSAIGDQVRVFVEPGRTSEAPDQILVALAQQGDGTLVLTLLDRVTSDPITHATVLAGSAVTSNGGTNGVYTLSVPVIVQDPNAQAGTQPDPTTVKLTADGYDENDTDANFIVQLVANETVTLTKTMNPLAAFITGQIQISAYQTLYNLTDVIISSDRISRRDLTRNLLIETSGYFSVGVPSSNAFNTRQFNLRFDHPLLNEAVVSNIVVPRANGTRQLTSPVVMTPITVDLVGTVSDSNGNAPNQLNPSGLPDTATVRETGQMANIINGAYTIPNVPTASTQVQPNQFNVDVVAYNPFATNPSGGVGAVEQGTTTVTPVSDGTANPTFQVPLITTSSGGSS